MLKDDRHFTGRDEVDALLAIVVTWLTPGTIFTGRTVEAGAGLLMMAEILTWLSAPAAFIVASIGAASAIKAVYIDK